MLEPLFEAAKNEYLPQLSTRQVRRWFQHYLQFGQVPAETREFYQRTGKNIGQRLSFDEEDKRALDQIIREELDLYLDEIQDKMFEMQNKRWAPSTLWRQLQRQNYSLQVCTYRAIQQSMEERVLYRRRLNLIVKHPSQAIFIDESHKSANESGSLKTPSCLVAKRSHASPRCIFRFRWEEVHAHGCL
jgi:hypothetical protein